mmetsp:Transcript_20230/g.68526  ORF Transcript_20230/g.68526 Transcript_20230/m.68526 type:complete len:274 (-) Transcript_20230:24-845(-)
MAFLITSATRRVSILRPASRTWRRPGTLDPFTATSFIKRVSTPSVQSSMSADETMAPVTVNGAAPPIVWGKAATSVSNSLINVRSNGEMIWRTAPIVPTRVAARCISQNQSYCAAWLGVVHVARPAIQKGDDRKSWVDEYASDQRPPKSSSVYAWPAPTASRSVTTSETAALARRSAVSPRAVAAMARRSLSFVSDASACVVVFLAAAAASKSMMVWSLLSEGQDSSLSESRVCTPSRDRGADGCSAATPETPKTTQSKRAISTRRGRRPLRI